MTNTISPDGDRVRRILQALEDTNEAWRALSSMLVTAIEQGDGLNHIAYGVQSLLTTQVEDTEVNLEDLREALFPVVASPAQFDTARELRSKIIRNAVKEAGGDLGHVAQALSMRKSTIERVMGQLQGDEDGTEDTGKPASKVASGRN